MLDIQALRNDLANVAARLASRGFVLDTAKFEQLEAERKQIQVRTQELQAKHNVSTKLMKQLDCGKAFRYAHDEAGGYAAGENYFPDDMPGVSFYLPTDRGLEAKISEKLARLRELDNAKLSQ